MSRSLALLVLPLAAAFAPAAPALGDKPVRYEYAELKYGRVAVPAQPGAPAGASRLVVRLITADDEIETNGWEDMANKLKAPAPKKEGASVIQHKLRVLNRLSQDGWEIVEHTGSDGTTPGTAAWVLRRRAP